MINEVWGVELYYDTYFSSRGGGVLSVSFRLLKDNPRRFLSGHFFTNNAIRSAVKKMGIETPLSLGSARLNVSRDERVASWENFYPYDKLPEDYGDEIRSIGIVQLAELRTLLRLKKDFPRVKWIAHEVIEHSREDHLRARGLKSKEGYVRNETFALAREIRALRQKIARDMWRHVPPKPNSLRARTPRRRWTHPNLVRRRKMA